MRRPDIPAHPLEGEILTLFRRLPTTLCEIGDTIERLARGRSRRFARVRLTDRARAGHAVERKMKLFRICATVAALCICIVPAANAYLVNLVSYQELFDKSDLIVIASPVTKTADTDERTYFQNLSQTDKDRTQTRIAAIVVETTFGVSVVMKGDRATKQFILHHYRPDSTPDVVFIGGPHIFSFFPPAFQAPLILFFL